MYSVVANGGANQTGGGDGSDLTTGSIDTSGADFIILSGSYFSTGSVVSDSKGNTWQGLTEYPDSSGDYSKMWYAYNAIVGSGHTFTLSQGGGTHLYNGALCVLAVKGALTASDPFDVQSTSNSTNTPVQPGSITPSQDNELVVAMMADGAGSLGITVDSGFTIINQLIGAGFDNTAQAYLIQTSAGAVNPSFTYDTATWARALIASFKSLATGSVARVNWLPFPKFALAKPQPRARFPQ